MKPYYSDSNVTLYCGDAAEIIPSLPPIDLTVTSPPYDNLRTYNGYTFDFEAIAQGLWQVTKPGGVVVWVVGDATIDGSETGTSFRQALRFKEIGFNLHDTMIYETIGTGAAGSSLSYWQGFEYMLVLSRGIPQTVNRLQDRPNVKAGTSQYKSVGGRSVNKYGKPSSEKYTITEYGYRTNVWRFMNGNNGDYKTIHPAPFPEALANDHIRSWSNPGDLILDPMCGSGTTLKMARKNGCKAIGIDISEEYCELTVNRLRQNVFSFA